jgi:hypothetical protein
MAARVSDALTPTVDGPTLSQMKPPVDAEAERMLEEADYIWSDGHKGYVRARRKGQSVADYQGDDPDVISEEELSDNSLTDLNVSTQERSKALGWLAERIEQGS